MGASGSAGGLAPAGVRSPPPRRIFRGWPEGAVRGGLAATPARNESSRPAVASRAEGTRPRGHPLLDRAPVSLRAAHHGAVGPVLRRGSALGTNRGLTPPAAAAASAPLSRKPLGGYRRMESPMTRPRFA